MKGKHTIAYDGYAVGDKVWVWAYWIPLVAEVEIVGMELNQYGDKPGEWDIYYGVDVPAPNGDTDQHSYSIDELYDSKKEALEAAIKDQEKLVSEWQADTNKQETTLGCLKQELLAELLNGSEA